MGMIELHVRRTGHPVMISTDAISQVGMTLEGDPAQIVGGYVTRIDGGTVDVRETYREIVGGWILAKGNKP